MLEDTVEKVIDRDPEKVAKAAGFSEEEIKEVMAKKEKGPVKNSEMIIDLFRDEKMQKMLDRQMLMSTEAQSVGPELTIVKLIFATALGAAVYHEAEHEVKKQEKTNEGHA